MYSDRELLELAARAYGIEIEWRRSAGSYYYDDPETGREEWSPLDYDGQAFRLAVKLGLCIMCHATQVEYSTKNGGVGIVVEQKFRDAGATRRAIVRAAAAIGEAMK